MTTSFQTEFHEPDVLLAALAAAGLDGDVERMIVKIGSLEVDLSSGAATSSSDEAVAVVSRLRQLYAEANYRKELARQGGEVERRGVDQNGDIVLMCVVFDETTG